MNITFTPIIFPDHTIPLGALNRDMGCQACWYFYLLAQKQKETVGEGPSTQIIMEGDPWMDTHYVELARNIAMVYGLESPDEFAKYWDLVRQEAYVCGLPIPADEYTRLAKGILKS